MRTISNNKRKIVEVLASKTQKTTTKTQNDMAQTVSNDALWEKLSEMEKGLSELAKTQKSSAQTPEQVGLKDEIIAEIKEQAHILGKHGDSNYGAINQNVATLDEILRKVWNIVTHIRKQQREAIGQQIEGSKEPQLDLLEPQSKDNYEFFNFRFFKVKKTSIVITMLGILIFTLTIFCMKQQDDYSLLTEVCYKQSLYIDQVKTEADSLRNVIKPNIKKKK